MADRMPLNQSPAWGRAEGPGHGHKWREQWRGGVGTQPHQRQWRASAGGEAHQCPPHSGQSGLDAAVERAATEDLV